MQFAAPVIFDRVFDSQIERLLANARDDEAVAWLMREEDQLRAWCTANLTRGHIEPGTLLSPSSHGRPDLGDIYEGVPETGGRKFRNRPFAIYWKRESDGRPRVLALRFTRSGLTIRRPIEGDLPLA